jgi:hypothetical protein
MSAPVVKTSSPACTCKEYLWNWREILAALAFSNDPESRRRVRDANTKFGGPIILPGKGGQPKVCKQTLLAWWDELEEKFQQKEQRHIDQEATLAASYQYGKNATVLPNIAGHVRKRRQT